MIIKGYLFDGFAKKVYHIHVRNLCDSNNHTKLWDEIYFRDYLIAHPETAQEYAALKRNLFENYEHNREGYTAAKGAFIRRITKKEKEKNYDFG